jgi:hypothetical protein
MDLLGLKKKKALSYSVEYMRSILGPVQRLHGLPPFFWDDEFVLGFTGISIGSCTRAVASDLSHMDKGIVLASAFEQLANMNGIHLSSRATDLLTARTPDCMHGSENGAVVFGYMHGMLKADDPDVLRANEIAQQKDYEGVGGALTYLLFNQVIRQRFRSS